MELKLEHGDYVRRETGTLERLSDREALAQRVRIRLTVPRGRFPFWETELSLFVSYGGTKITRQSYHFR